MSGSDTTSTGGSDTTHKSLRARRIAVLAAIVGVIGVVALHAPPAHAAHETESRRVARFVDHWFATRPHGATHAGIRGFDRLLVPVTEATLDSERAWVAAFAAGEPGAEPPAAGSLPAGSPEAQLLRARVERMRIDLDELRPFERNPGAYLPLVDGAIRELLFVTPGSMILRLRAAARRLERVPEVLRAAQINLKHPSRLATEVAIEDLGRTLDFYRHDIPRVSRDVRDATTLADLAEADTLGARAVEGFIEWLRVDVLPHADTTISIGPEMYARVLVTETVRPVSLGDVEQVIERGIADCRVLRPALEADVLARAHGDGAEAARASARADSALGVIVARAMRRLPADATRWRTRVGLGPASAIVAWAEFAAWRTPVPDTAAAMRLAAESRQLALFARQAAEVAIHAHGASLDDATTMVRTRCGLDSTEARELVRRAAAEPGAGVAALHLAGWRALRDEARTRLGKAFEARRVDAALAAQSPSPPDMVRDSILRHLKLANSPR